MLKSSILDQRDKQQTFCDIRHKANVFHIFSWSETYVYVINYVTSLILVSKIILINPNIYVLSFPIDMVLVLFSQSLQLAVLGSLGADDQNLPPFQ